MGSAEVDITVLTFAERDASTVEVCPDGIGNESGLRVSCAVRLRCAAPITAAARPAYSRKGCCKVAGLRSRPGHATFGPEVREGAGSVTGHWTEFGRRHELAGIAGFLGLPC